MEGELRTKDGFGFFFTQIKMREIKCLAGCTASGAAAAVSGMLNLSNGFSNPSVSPGLPSCPEQRYPLSCIVRTGG